MVTHVLSRLFTLVILAGLTIGSIQSVAEPRDRAPVEHLVPLHDSAQQGEEEHGTTGSPSSSGRFAATNLSLVPNGPATAVCTVDAGEDAPSARDSSGPWSEVDAATCTRQPETNGEYLSAGTSAPGGVGAGSCDVLVAAALETVEYFVDNDFLNRLSTLTQSNADYFNGVTATPTLADLLQYDMVIAFSDNIWHDRVQMGDVLGGLEDPNRNPTDRSRPQHHLDPR